MDSQLIESTEFIDSQLFYKIMELTQKLNICEVNEKTKSIVIGETTPTISYFNKEKCCWSIKRRAKVIQLKANTNK